MPGALIGNKITLSGSVRSRTEVTYYKHGFLRVSVKELFLSAQAAHDDRGVATQRAMTLD